MDLGFTEEQEMLRKMARDFLTEKCPKTHVREMEEDEKGYSPEVWAEMAELGWLGLPLPEKYGGGGMDFVDLAVLLEEMGRALLPSPFFTTVVVGALPIAEMGTEEQKQKYLPLIAQGKAIFTLALTEDSASYEADGIAVKATADGNDYVISGTKLFVSDAHVADYLLCAVRTKEAANKEEGITLFIVDAKSPGISCTVLQTISSDKLCEVTLDKVRVPRENILGELDRGWPLVKKIIQLGAAGKCMEMAGASQAVLEMTTDYAKERIQFGVPIGSFQAVQHHCANMKVDVDGTRYISYEAAWTLSEGLPCAKEVSMAKAWVSDAHRRVCALGHQVHGGIGFTKDHDLQLFFRRAKAAEVTFGEAEFHRELVARELGL